MTLPLKKRWKFLITDHADLLLVFPRICNAITAQGATRARSVICAIHGVRGGMRPNGNEMAPKQNNIPIQTGTDRFTIKLMPNTKRLNGNKGPDPNNNI